MRVTASIGEPFLLSTYGVFQHPSRNQKNKGNPTNIFASHEKVSNNSDGYATVAVRSEGVHVLDVSTLHPVVSHTLGPSTTFSCPAITRNTHQGADNLCITYAAIASSPDVKEDERGRTLWMWKENLSSQLEQRSSQKRQSVVISHKISALHICHDLPTRILAQSSTGDITALDDDLKIKRTWAASQDSTKILRMFVYSRAACSFLPPQSSPRQAAILIMIVAVGASTHLQIMSLDDSDEILEFGSLSVAIKNTKILDVSCNSSGYTSFLTRTGTWHCYLLDLKDSNSIKLSSVSEPIPLNGLSFSSDVLHSEEVSIISLASSHVLLSALTSSSSPEIVLLLWDLKYSVLLASQSLPIPSTLTQTKGIVIQITLVPASDSQALLLLSPRASKTSEDPPASRSSVLVIPLTCPSKSTIANAMGQASSSASWIKPPPPPDQWGVVVSMKGAMKKNLPKVADGYFFRWEQQEYKNIGDNPTGEVGQLPALNYPLIKDLLEVVLQPSQPANTPYSPSVIRYLLNRWLVSTDMVPGGLLACLRAKNDWTSITLALAKVADLSETEIMECLYLVVVEHRTHDRAAAQQQEDAMEVDTVPSSLPTLPAFLSSCVLYRTTPSALRDAIRRCFKEAEDLHEILVLLKDWIKQWGKRDIQFWPGRKDHGEDGIPVVQEKRYGDIPPLSNVLTFAQTFLDSSFLTLLRHPPSHSIIRAVHALLEPQVLAIDELEQLRAPLGPFAQAQSKVLQGRAPVLPSELKQKRKQAHEYAEAAVGSYRLEEIFL